MGFIQKVYGIYFNDLPLSRIVHVMKQCVLQTVNL